MVVDGFVAPDVARVIELRVEKGLLLARRIALQEALLTAIDDATSLDDLKPVLRTLVRKED